MRNKAVILLAAIATLSLGATSSQVFADDAMKAVQKDFKDFDDAMKAVQRLRDQQHAKCEMDANQYFAEHSLGLTGDQLESLWPT